MKLGGIHHVAAITGDGDRCIDFYAGVLGLDLVVRTMQQDSAGTYQLRFAEPGDGRGSVLTFLEVPGIEPGRPGAGTIHRIGWRAAGPDALEFWAKRLAAAGIHSEHLALATDGDGECLRFAGPEGLAHEINSRPVGQAPSAASARGIPSQFALHGFHGVRCFVRDRTASADLLAGRLGFAAVDENTYRVGDGRRSARYAYDEAPAQRAVPGAGTVHHVAWACEEGEQPIWRQRVIGLGARVTPILDRSRYRSIYFREPSGVLFEIASRTLQP